MKTHQTGTISEVQYVPVAGGVKCEVRVKVDGRSTAWLPKSASVGGAYKMHIPPRVGDQVIVHNENGKNEDGYVTNNIAFDTMAHHKLVDENNIVMWSEDGTTFVTNIKDKIITLNTPSFLDVTVDNSVKITVNEDVDVKVKGNLTASVDGNVDVEVKGNLTASVDGNVDVDAKVAITLKAPTITLDGAVNATSTLAVASTISDAKGDLTSHVHTETSKVTLPR